MSSSFDRLIAVVELKTLVLRGGRAARIPVEFKSSPRLEPAGRRDGADHGDLTAKGMDVPFGRRHVVRNSRS
jgi:hypothetical protein